MKQEYNLDLAKMSLTDFIKDIESIFIGYDKKEVRRIGLKRLLQAVYDKGFQDGIEDAKIENEPNNNI
jgi:hypothetical protein